MMISAQKLAARLNATLRGDDSIEISNVSSAANARQGDVTFAETAKHLQEALTSAASAIITSTRLAAAIQPSSSKALITASNPRAAFARTLQLFFPPTAYEPGVHPAAVVGSGVELGDGVHVGPHAVLKANARIGARSAIDAGAVVGEGSVVGEDCVIHPHVTIYPHVVIGNRVIVHAGAVIGSDGFGYVTEAGQHMKFPQVGNVVIEDDVEIGANTAIDRATVGSTVIKRGAKIDNLVQIAHNNTIGEHCLIAAQAGLAGSVTLGKYVMLGGQVGIADHKTVGDQVMIGAQGGVIGNIPAKSVVWGTPAQANREWLRQLAALRRLPGILKELAAKGLLGPGPQQASLEE